MGTPNNALSIGTVLEGQNVRYRIDKVLGQGAFGITYKATGFTVIKGALGEEVAEMARPKAIKEFFMNNFNQREASTSQVSNITMTGLASHYSVKFRKEAETLASMNHPNIVKVIDFIEANNTFYYVMDFIEGQDLSSYIKHNKLSEDEIVAIIREVASAIKYMHEEKHVLHLDLKPGNIMRRTEDGHVFVIDFGLSKHFDDNGNPDSSTAIGMGTEGYAPVEQGSKITKDSGFRSTIDVYALGATFYKLLTGKTPPVASDVVEDPDVIGENLKAAGVSERFANVVIRAMQPSAKKRIQTVAEFIGNLDMGTPPPIPVPKNEEPENEEATSYTIADTRVMVSEQVDRRAQMGGGEDIPESTGKTQQLSTNKSKVPVKLIVGIAAAVVLLALIGVGVVFFLLPMLNKTDTTEVIKVDISDGEGKSAVDSKDMPAERKFEFGDNSLLMKLVESGTTKYDGGELTVDHSYYMAEAEVPQWLWKEIMGNNPSSLNDNERPVEQVTYEDCQAFIRKLNEKTGETFRLPTVEEWEYAARGGKKGLGFEYSGSGSALAVGWIKNNSEYSTHPVKKLEPNELGLYDMCGNVSEFCKSSGDNSIVCGGDFMKSDDACRPDSKAEEKSSVRTPYIGLRLAM